MPKQRVYILDTSANTDRLAGTDLENAPSPGVVDIWVASSLGTAIVTIVAGGENIVRAQSVPLRANGVPQMSDDPPTAQILVTGGEKIVVNVGGTVGSYSVLAIFTPIDEL